MQTDNFVDVVIENHLIKQTIISSFNILDRYAFHNNGSNNFLKFLFPRVVKAYSGALFKNNNQTSSRILFIHLHTAESPHI